MSSNNRFIPYDNSCAFPVPIPGEQGIPGPTGEQGVPGAAQNVIYLATDQEINTNQFFGLGTSQGGNPDFARNNVVIPQAGTITGIVLSIRNKNLVAGATVSAEIVVSDTCATTTINTGIIATVVGSGSPTNCCAVGTGSFPVDQCDLLSVRITITRSGALMNGAAATILFAT